MLHRFLMTSVVIFVKPGTTAQLAATFMVNLGFLMLHVQTNAFKTHSENISQFLGLISILLVLFSGIVLRYNEVLPADADDNDPYNQMTITVVLMSSQIGVAAIFVSKVFYPGKKKKEKDSLMKAVANAAGKAVMDNVHEQKEKVLDGVEGLLAKLVQEEKLSPCLNDLAHEYIAGCRGKGEEKEESTAKLSDAMMTADLEKMQDAVFSLCIKGCGNSQILVNYAIEKGQQLLEKAGTPIIFVNLFVSGVRMAPRAQSTFESIRTHMQDLASQCCDQSNPVKTVTRKVLQLVVQICGGEAVLVRISNDVFFTMKQQLTEQGFSPLGLSLIIPMSKKAASSIFKELLKAENPDEDAEEPDQPEEELDYLTLLLKVATVIDGSSSSEDAAFTLLQQLAAAIIGQSEVSWLMDEVVMRMAERAAGMVCPQLGTAVITATKVACKKSDSGSDRNHLFLDLTALVCNFEIPLFSSRSDLGIGAGSGSVSPSEPRPFEGWAVERMETLSRDEQLRNLAVGVLTQATVDQLLGNEMEMAFDTLISTLEESGNTCDTVTSCLH